MLFHREEENRGGVGSKFIAKRTPALLTGIDYAHCLGPQGLARRDHASVSGAVCSDAFAKSLAQGLNADGMA